jgi:hypothetical protein
MVLEDGRKALYAATPRKPYNIAGLGLLMRYGLRLSQRGKKRTCTLKHVCAIKWIRKV